MRNSTLISALSLLSLPASAALTLVSSDFNAQGNTLVYGSEFFSDIDVLAGDVLVITHANNKRDNGSNTISATVGSEAISTIPGGESGGQAGAWIFYSTISAPGSVDVILNTSNASTNGSKANGYYLLRPGSGETIVLASSDADAGVDGTSLGLSFDAGAAGGFGVLAAAVGTNTLSITGSDWNLDQNAADKRQLYSDASVSDLNPSFTVVDGDDEVAVGAVFQSVPEPSVALLGGLGILTLIRRRR